MNRHRRRFALAGIALAPAVGSLAVSAGVFTSGLFAAPAARAETPITLLSPWTLNRSGYFLQGTLSFLSTSDFYDGNGNKTPDPFGQKLRDFSTGIHLEYGIRDWLGLVAAVPVRSLNIGALAGPDFNTTGFGDFTGGLRVRLLKQPLTASAQVEVKLPTGYNAKVTVPPLGDGQTDFTGRLLAGWSYIDDVPIFVQAAGGYRVRLRDPANEILLNADAGGWVHERVALVGSWEYVEHKGEGAIGDFFKGGASARARVHPDLDVVGGAFHIFGGQNTPAGTQFFVGVAYKGNRLDKSQGLFPSTLSNTPPPPAATAPPPAEPPKPETTEPDTTKTPETPTPPPPTPPNS